jgi:hypothetical protein
MAPDPFSCSQSSFEKHTPNNFAALAASFTEYKT